MKQVIKISNLHKSFGDVHAVNDLSFEVRKGELFAFLGVNGAGKSTTISIMCGNLQKDSGTVEINGYDMDTNANDILPTIGVVYQNSALDTPLSVMDNLLNKAMLYGMDKATATSRIQELAKELNFADLLNRTVGKLSGGQRRRIDVARALLHHPKILILDEPTTGLDPMTRKTLWQVISDLRIKEKMTVFLTTHYMEEATDSDYVIILDHGQIVAEGTPLDLKGKYASDYLTIYNVKESDVAKLGFPYTIVRDGYKLSIPNTSVACELINKNTKLFKDFELTKGKMDDVFLSVTGNDLNGEV